MGWAQGNVQESWGLSGFPDFGADEGKDAVGLDCLSLTLGQCAKLIIPGIASGFERYEVVGDLAEVEFVCMMNASTAPLTAFVTTSSTYWNPTQPPYPANHIALAITTSIRTRRHPLEYICRQSSDICPPSHAMPLARPTRPVVEDRREYITSAKLGWRHSLVGALLLDSALPEIDINGRSSPPNGYFLPTLWPGRKIR